MKFEVGDKVKVKDMYFNEDGSPNGDKLEKGVYGRGSHKDPVKGQVGTVVKTKYNKIYVNFSDREPDNPDRFSTHRYLTITRNEIEHASTAEMEIAKNYQI